MARSPQEILSQGQDILAILDQALAAGGGTFTCETHGKAVHWRQRAYQVRKAYRNYVMPKLSPYDRLTLRKIQPDSTEVVIDVVRMEGTFTPRQPATPTFAPIATDELETEAADLARTLGLSEDDVI